MSYSWMRTATHSLLYSTKLECVGDDSKQDPRGTIIEHSRATSKSFPIFGHIRQNFAVLLEVGGEC